MGLPTFLLYSALGTGSWALILTYLGRLLGDNYDAVDTYLGPISYIVLEGLLIFCIVWLVRRRAGRGRGG